jgi:hypothetical protein
MKYNTDPDEAAGTAGSDFVAAGGQGLEVLTGYQGRSAESTRWPIWRIASISMRLPGRIFINPASLGQS